MRCVAVWCQQLAGPPHQSERCAALLDPNGFAMSMGANLEVASGKWPAAFCAHLAAAAVARATARETPGLHAAVKKREDTHRMAEANKAFSHYRW